MESQYISVRDQMNVLTCGSGWPGIRAAQSVEVRVGSSTVSSRCERGSICDLEYQYIPYVFDDLHSIGGVS